MKRFFSIFCAVFILLSLSSCTEEPLETTEEQTSLAPQEEITTSAPVSVDVMSPPTADTALPFDVQLKLKDIDFDSFEKIAAKDSVFPDSDYDRILRSENAEYFFSEENKVLAVFFDSDESICASASYDTESGIIEFFGNDVGTWYYDKEAKLECYVYTYKADIKNAAPIYTFYDAEGNKIVTRTMGGWYDAELYLLDEAETLDIIKRFAFTIEATVEY